MDKAGQCHSVSAKASKTKPIKDWLLLFVR
jgi:hypothetical protein